MSPGSLRTGRKAAEGEPGPGEGRELVAFTLIRTHLLIWLLIFSFMVFRHVLVQTNML